MTRTDWSCLARDALLSGSVASVASSLVLALNGKREIDDAAAPLNGPSQWVWGRSAPYENGFTVRHTVLGYAIHHVASVFWALFYELLRGRRGPGAAAAGTTAAITTALATVVDYGVTPQRFRPGFEKRLSRGALLGVYAAFGVGLAAATIACGSRASRRKG